MIEFFTGVFVGVLVGVCLMALFAINEFEE